MQTHRYSHMVHEYYVVRLRQIMAKRRERIASLKTRNDAEKYVAHARHSMQRSLGPLPKRTPLNTRITSRRKYPYHRLENIVFESRQGFLVTGNLYLPLGQNNTAPGVLVLCGHSPKGKAAPVYQAIAQGLAHKGFVAFLMDGISQGERRQFYPADGGKRPGLCDAHNIIGNPLSLVGDSLASWFAWDAIRGLDVLLSRPEVNKAHIGVTGNSGGGTQTSYLTALDRRVTMSAPGCYIGSFLANLENEEPADVEQNPPGMLAAGLDHVDMLLTYGARPTILLSQEDDFFDVRTARAAFEDLRKVHRLLGARDTAALYVGKGEHGYTKENREAMNDFFMRQVGLKSSPKETKVVPVAEAELNVLPRGGTYRAGSRRVFEMTGQTADELARTRKPLRDEALQKAVKKVLGVRIPRSAPHYRALMGATGWKGPLGEKRLFSIESEPGIQVLIRTHANALYIMRSPAGRAKLLVGHIDSEEDLKRPDILRLVGDGKIPLVTVDPRGMGQSLSKAGSDREFLTTDGHDCQYASLGVMLNEPYLGRRVWDVMRVMDFMLAGGVTKIELIGRGIGSVIAAFTGLLHPSNPKVTLLNYLQSYQLLTETPLADWPQSVMARGLIKQFDLPDVYRELTRRLTLLSPWSGKMRPFKTNS